MHTWLTVTTLRDAFLDEVRDIYHAEKQLVKALPKMAKAATDPELKSALENHLTETENQISRIEQVFELVGEKPETKTCAGMAGIIEEGSEVLAEDAVRRSGRDDHRLGAARRALRDRGLRHRRRVGRGLGLTDAAELLRETLDEEKEADETLTSSRRPGSTPPRAGRTPAAGRTRTAGRY